MIDCGGTLGWVTVKVSEAIVRVPEFRIDIDAGKCSTTTSGSRTVVILIGTVILSLDDVLADSDVG